MLMFDAFRARGKLSVREVLYAGTSKLTSPLPDHITELQWLTG